MTPGIRLTSSAHSDLRDAMRWYEAQKAGLGSDYLSEVDHVFSRIGHAPQQFPEIESGVRRALLRRFPYAVYFLVEANHVEIIALLHLRRDPENWRNR